MKALLADLVRIGRFRPAPGYQRPGYVVGALLMASGAFHLVVFLVDGGGWEGPLSWRKPILFGLSFGITVLTFTWILGFLRPRAWAGWLVVGTLGAASLVEVFLISMQTWRGVPSHFNDSTAFDESVFSMMGLMVTVVGVVTVLLTVWAFARLDAQPSLALAIRAGLLLVLVSQGVGVQMITEGGHTFGAAGALKVPHAFTLHAVQVLPALALALLASDSSEARRVRLVALATAGYAVIVASTMVQTYAGRGPLDLTVLSSLMALVGLAMLGVSAVVAVRGLLGRHVPPNVPPATPAGPAVQGGAPWSG